MRNWSCDEWNDRSGWTPDLCTERSTGGGFALQSWDGDVTSSLDSWIWRPQCLHQSVLPAEMLFWLDFCSAAFNSPVSLSSSSIHLSRCGVCSLDGLGSGGYFLCMILAIPPPPATVLHSTQCTLGFRQTFHKHLEAITKAFL